MSGQYDAIIRAILDKRVPPPPQRMSDNIEDDRSHEGRQYPQAAETADRIASQASKAGSEYTAEDAAQYNNSRGIMKLIEAYKLRAAIPQNGVPQGNSPLALQAQSMVDGLTALMQPPQLPEDTTAIPSRRP